MIQIMKNHSKKKYGNQRVSKFKMILKWKGLKEIKKVLMRQD